MKNALKLIGTLTTLVLTFGLANVGYAQMENATIGGYGELHYNDVTYDANGSQTPGQFDFHRFILYAGYNFNDWITFRSELEIEHTYVKDDHGEVALEQAYIDMRYKPTLGVRAGIMLVPVGIVNPIHEPPTFNGVERPNVEKYIIPSTWREAGAGIYGQSPSGLSYELYVMAGLDASAINGEEFIRGARQKAFYSSTDNWAATGRLDYRANLNLTLGGSYFFSDLSTDGEYGDAMTGTTLHMFEGHMIYSKGGFEGRGLAVYSFITDVDQLNSTFTMPANPLGPRAGESQYGAYGELSYDLFHLTSWDTEQQLDLFGRAEVYNTHATTVNFPENPEYDRYEYTFGLTYKPTTQVAFKADYQLLQSAGTKNIHQLNIGVGYNF